MTDAIERRAARVLVIDDAGRLLMLHGMDPARPEHAYWFTPGGGLNPDETSAVAAARELHEEAGLQVDPADLGEPVWREATEFPFDGRWYRQRQEFFLLRTRPWDVDLGGLDDIEQGSIDGYRWWSIDELVASGERYYPTGLPGVLREVGA